MHFSIFLWWSSELWFYIFKYTFIYVQVLGSAESLQSHFVAFHEVSENRNDDVFAMKMEVNDLNASLKVIINLNPINISTSNRL